jgi:hypothetical protein
MELFLENGFRKRIGHVDTIIVISILASSIVWIIGKAVIG